MQNGIFTAISDIDVSGSMEKSVTQHSFESLGEYEKKFLLDVGKLLNVFKSEDKIDFVMLKKLLGVLSTGIQDHEKRYLIGLIFPETIDKAYYFSPLPIKTYTFRQRFNFSIDVSQKGNFLLQVKSPAMFSKNSQDSDFLYCNKPGIGISNDTNNFSDSIPGNWIRVAESRVATELFSAYMLVGMGITVTYTGTIQDQSGRFGAGYTLTSCHIADPDLQFIDFDVVKRTSNFVETETSNSLKVVYFPPDNSFMEFRLPDEDAVMVGRQPLSHVINIYGRGLAVTQNSSIKVEVNRAFSCIPNPNYSSVLEVAQPNVIENTNSIRSFITRNNLAVHRASDVEFNSLDNIPLNLNDINKLDQSQVKRLINEHKYESNIIL